MSIAVLEGVKKKSQFYNDVIEGLQKSQKTIPSKYFYDKWGSELFEKICELDEYYLTRTELSIMKQNIDEIARKLGSDIQLVELGSGSSLKTRMLLNNLPNIHSYVPVDISDDFLADVADELQAEYPELNIIPVAADYTRPFELPVKESQTRRIAYYPGSTIGNFTKEEAGRFIALIADLIEDEGGLLIGFDLLKDEETLIAAYDDKQGVTAEFNKNILRRINNELEADFDLDAFEHKAVFNEEKSRIEMHLVSITDQTVEILNSAIHFEKGETIHTENSHKYSLASFRKLTKGHFHPVKTWMDKDEMFAVQFLEK
ncbi:L-histidine N(alpha)-methyltransferase [Gracilimonas sp.]|uniref:L-histidine N(alpha)-methyltransferase n=1 Tax=Gracilimonas sp. TaxID=1974203 RepID=UPI0028722BB8|nr:L-histidine N(alpha)-methyltransferase [Gracilimonas sp.]